jgi:transposase
LPQSRIIAVDECGFNLSETSRYSWSFRGSRSFILKPGQRGLNHTLILCVRNIEKGGVVGYELIKNEIGKKKKDKREEKKTKKGVDAIDFHKFITNLKLPTNEKYYLMLDNARIHTATKACQKEDLSTIKELIISKNMEPIYLVSYSPQLNPVEEIFNNIRHNIEKSRPRTFEELKAAVDKEMERLNKEDLTKYFKSCLNYFD